MIGLLHKIQNFNINASLVY